MRGHPLHPAPSHHAWVSLLACSCVVIDHTATHTHTCPHCTTLLLLFLCNYRCITGVFSQQWRHSSHWHWCGWSLHAATPAQRGCCCCCWWRLHYPLRGSCCCTQHVFQQQCCTHRSAGCSYEAVPELPPVLLPVHGHRRSLHLLYSSVHAVAPAQHTTPPQVVRVVH
jgi:hypothetical protein